jgi:hypothetical protein
MKSGQQSVIPSEAPRHDHYGPVTNHVKTEAVLRLLRGESAEAVSQELGIPVSRIERWKQRFVEGGTAELARRKSDPHRSWLAKHSSRILPWVLLLLVLIAVISILAVVMQRGAPD